MARPYDDIISHEDLLKEFEYFDDGTIRPRFGKKAGQDISRLVRNRTMYIRGKYPMVHRLVFFYHNGYYPPSIDHLDGDFLNNRIENLRHADHVINAKNRKLNSRNKTGHTGIYFDKRYEGKKPWSASLTHNGKDILSKNNSFATKEEAIEARRVAIEKVNEEVGISRGFTKRHGKRR